MNITFLIGNGFDIGMGLKSQFRDFFPIYVEQSKSKPEEIRMLSERINGDFETWADFEARMGDYTAEFSGESKGLYIKQIRDFEMEFMKYLIAEEEKLLLDADEVMERIEDGLRNFYKRTNLRNQSSDTISIVRIKHASEEHKYHFLTFNYTSVLEECLQASGRSVVMEHAYNGYKRIDKVGEVVHIHGSSDNGPIMGVNDTSQIANAELAKDEKFVRYLVKPTLNSLHRTDHDAEGARLIADSHIICIYGMSLGATDRCWWERILQWLNDEEERQLVIFDHDPGFSERTQFDWPDKEDAMMEKLARYVPDPKMDIEELRPRIHIAVNKDIFQLPSKKAEDSKPLAPVS